MVLLGRALMNRIFKQFPVGVRDPGVDKLARYKATPSGRKGINAARDFHRYVHRSGKAFPVKISSAKIPIRKKVRTTCGKRRAKEITVDYPIIHLSSWMKSILETRPEFLLGGHCPFENDGAPYMDMFSCFLGWFPTSSTQSCYLWSEIGGGEKILHSLHASWWWRSWIGQNSSISPVISSSHSFLWPQQAELLKVSWICLSILGIWGPYFILIGQKPIAENKIGWSVFAISALGTLSRRACFTAWCLPTGMPAKMLVWTRFCRAWLMIWLTCSTMVSPFVSLLVNYVFCFSLGILWHAGSWLFFWQSQLNANEFVFGK